MAPDLTTLDNLDYLDLTKDVRRVVANEIAQWGPPQEVQRSDSSNVLVQLRFAQNRGLIIKQAQHYPETAARRLQASRRAARLLREKVGVLAPDHLVFPRADEHAIVAYRRIDLPTLEELWPRVPDCRKSSVLRGLGGMIRRMHRVHFPGYGDIADDDALTTLSTFLQHDLAGRLRPAVYAEWPTALAVTDRLIEAIPLVAERVSQRRDAVLIHSDLHMANILCEVEEDEIQCVGVLDLESVFAGPPEADLARLSVYHGPLFGHPLFGSWFERVWEGYGEPLDPLLLAFFRGWHLVNIGFHSAVTGQRAHADRLARAAQEEVNAIAWADEG